MRRSDLYNARTEVCFNIIIGNDRNFTVNYREDNCFADKILVTLVSRVYSNGCIAEESFGTCCGKLDISAAAGKGIAEMPEMTCLIFVIYFRIGNRGLAVRTPVDDPFASVDKSLVIKVYENLTDSLVAALVHCEAFSRPVAGAAELFELFNDPAAELCFPCPCSFHKCRSADLFLGKTLFGHSRNDLGFGRYSSVVSAREPEC